MKRLIPLLLLIVLAITSNDIAAVAYRSYNVVLVKCYNSGEPKEVPDPKGRRTPTRPIVCTITEGAGIDMPITSDDITGYELWDADGEICLGVYSDDIDAANHIFSIPGEYQLVIETEEYSYVGFISTL